MRGEDVGRVAGVAGEGGELVGAETIGVVIDGAAAELGELYAGANVVLAVAPGDDFVDVDRVFGFGYVGLSAAADERAADLDGLCVGDALGDVLVLLEGDLKLVDEGRGDDDAVVENGVVFAGVQVVAGFCEGDAADACVGAGAVLEVIAEGEAVVGREVVGDADGVLRIAVGGEDVFDDGAVGADGVDYGCGVLLAVRCRSDEAGVAAVTDGAGEMALVDAAGLGRTDGGRSNSSR